MTFFPWISFKAINKTSFTSFIFHPRKSLIYTTLYSPIHVYTTFDIVYKKINKKTPLFCMESEESQIETIAPLSFRATMMARLSVDDVTISWQSDTDGAIASWKDTAIAMVRQQWSDRAMTMERWQSSNAF